MPLLLVEALGDTSILQPLLQIHDEPLSVALDRTKSFFLVNACVADTLTFGLGPMLLEKGNTQDDDNKRRQRLA